VDFCPVAGTTPTTSFSTATISNPTKTGGNGTITGTTARGFFIEYANSTNAGTTVTAKLSNASGKFNWCAYGSDYPPNATATNGTYILKGTPPFVINGTTTLGAGVNTYSGGCITSLTDQTGCPGITNYAAISAGAINSSSTIVRTNATPAAITSNTAASSGGGITYRWVRSGTSSATYADNNAGHSFAAAEVNTAGTWIYYREVRDNTCATTTWSRSSGSYTLTVIACPYTGSDLYLTSSYPCQQRTSGAGNWQAYIKDSRDSELYRIVQYSNGVWWWAEDYRGSYGYERTCYGIRLYSATNKSNDCPTQWRLPTAVEVTNRFVIPAYTDSWGGALIAVEPFYDSSEGACWTDNLHMKRCDIIVSDLTKAAYAECTTGAVNALDRTPGKVRCIRQL
jgi:hypothetical protein